MRVGVGASIRPAAAGLRDRAAVLPLRWRIGSLVVLGLAFIFVLFGALGQAIARDAKERTVNEWASIATSTARVIDSEIAVQYDRLEELSARLSAAPDVAAQRRLLESAIVVDPLSGQAVLLGRDRTVLWPVPASTQAEEILRDGRVLDPAGAHARYASGVANIAGEPSIVLAVSVNGGPTPEVLAFVIAPGTGLIHDLVSSARGLANTGHAELVDQTDHVIVSTDARDVYRDGEHPDFYGPHLMDRTSGVGLTAPVGPDDPTDTGQRHDMAFVALSTVPWGFALGGSDAELSADAARWETETIVLGVASLLVALLLVLLTTRSVSRPVLALAAASRHIASGDLETPVPLGGEGEIRVLAQAFDDMRDKLRTALSELALQKSRYEGIVTSMADAVVTTNSAGVITAYNPAAAALTGWSAEAALGHRFADVVRAPSPGPDSTDRARVAQNGIGRLELERRDGRRVASAVTTAAISDRDGGSAGTVYVLRDVTAEAEVERMKEEFLATVSHELRTPLGFIMGYATSLLLPDAPNDAATIRRFLRVIADSSKELEGLVDDLLDMAKISSGTLSVTPRATTLAPLVDAAVERARVRSEKHVIRRSIPRALPGIQADERRIEQVLYDLLDNALKYSPDGGTVTISAVAAAGHVQVSVVDEGVGIGTDELQSVFERFHRGRDARLRGITGTGLGLAICKGIVEAHAGRIWAESPPAGSGPGARGCAIRFTLPIARATVALDELDAIARDAR